MRSVRGTWAAQLGIAAGSISCALLLTHLLWRGLQYTPFLLGFAAAILSTRLGGRKAGCFAVILGVLAYMTFPPPLPAEGLGRLVFGFVIIAGGFSWLVARRHEAEALLRTSESRLSEAQQVASLGSWDRNVKDGSEFWSDQVFRLLGVEPGSVEAGFETFSRFLHPDDRGVVHGVVRRALEDHQPFECENRIVRADGEIRTLHVQGRVVLDGHGQVARLVGTAHDITDRKVAEEATRRSQRRLQTIIDAEPACVKLVSADGRLLDMNRAGLAMIGADALAQVHQQPVVALVHAEDRDRYLELHRRALGGSAGRAEFRIVGFDGEERWMDSHAVPFDASGDTGEPQPAVLSVTSDITERVRAQRALRETEARMRLALEASRLGVWDADLRTGTVYWSETCEVLHGLGRGTFGKSFDAFLACVHSDDRQGVVKALESALADRRDVEIEYRVVWPDGAERHIRATARYFYDDAGVPNRGAGISTDVTERRSLEAQLRQSQKMEAVGLLAGGIAHDFNNLLTAIGGYTEVVLATLDDDDGRRADLDEVLKASRHAAALTRQLLAFSRRQTLQPTVLNVNRMLADLENLLRRTTPENIELELDLGAVRHPVRADRVQLEQVILNLSINARDAMPTGGRLRLATSVVDVDAAWALRHPPMSVGRYVRMTVGDTGTGMTEETRSRVFEPFFTTKELGKGTGLGLATVYGIVKQSGGFIWVDSQVGRGTRFDIYLPVLGEGVSAAAPVTAASATRDGGLETILLAEDEPAVRRLTREILRKQGYTVLEARDGEEALTLAREYSNAIDLLISDVVMPRVGGPELARRLTLDRPDVRVLYISGYNEHAVTGVGIPGGMLLPKPFRGAELLQKVRETLEVADVQSQA